MSESIQFIIKDNGIVFNSFLEFDQYLKNLRSTLSTTNITFILRFITSKENHDFIFKLNPLTEEFRFQRRHKVNINNALDSTYFYVFGKPSEGYIFFDIHTGKIEKYKDFNIIPF